MRKKIAAYLLTMTILLCSAVSSAQSAAKITDIDNSWAFMPISFLVERGDISGYPDGTFRPTKNISRAEFFTVINQAFEFNNEASLNFSDVKPSDWYYHEIARAQAAGYVAGYPDGTMRPNNLITRQEAAAIVSKVLKLNTANPGALTFSDAASIPAWSRNSIAAMVQAGYMKGYPDGTFKPLASLTRAETASIVANGINPELASGAVNVKWLGAQGDGTTDDTAAIQRAVAYTSKKGGGTVYIPAGTYLIDVDKSVSLESDIKLTLADQAVLKAKPTSSGSYSVIKINDAQDVEIIGGKIIGERNAHQGSSGEWGMGISMRGSSNIHIADITITDCWGDGIYVADTFKQNYCENVVIERFKIDNNRRQGISVISAKNLTIKNGTVSNTRGADPQCGIDLEPNNVSQYMQKVLIENVTAIDNAGFGLGFGYFIYQDSTIPSDVTVKNLTAARNTRGPYNDWTKYVDEYCRITVI